MDDAGACRCGRSARATCTADGAIGYRVEVTNSGDLTTHNVALSYTPPTGVTVLNSTPAAQLFGQRLEWRLGDLPPGTTSVVEAELPGERCRARFAAAFVATSTEVPEPKAACRPTSAPTRSSVKMTGPETRRSRPRSQVPDRCDQHRPTPLTNVTATDTFEPGLSHTGGERSPLVRPIAVIQPGQTERFADLVHRDAAGTALPPARRDGRRRPCSRSAGLRDGNGGGRHAAAAFGARQRSADAPSREKSRSYTVEVKNNGSGAGDECGAVRHLGHQPAADSKPRSGHEDNIPRLTTRGELPSSPAAKRITRQLNFLCLNADEQGAIVRATVASQQTAAVTNQAATVIVPARRPRLARPAATIGCADRSDPIAASGCAAACESPPRPWPIRSRSARRRRMSSISPTSAACRSGRGAERAGDWMTA